MIDFIDLFSGIGGFRLGLERVGGFRSVWSCDNNKWANTIYLKNWPNSSHFPSDIKGVDSEDIPDVNLLCAGFPCQSFSTSGKRKGFQDTRGTLFFEICRIAKAKRPSLLLLENVKGLLNHDGGRTFTIVLQSLDELGYWLEWQVLNSKHFGVPQNRERVFLIGHLRGGSTRPIFPVLSNGATTPKTDEGQDGQITNTVTRGNASGFSARGNYVLAPELAGTITGGGNSGGLHSDMNILAVHYGDSQQDRLHHIDGISPTIPTCRTPDKLKIIVENKKITERTGEYGSGFKEEEAFCLDSGSGRDQVIHQNMRIRRLTPIECERLQGFPDGWTEGVSKTQRYRLLGNAVTVNVIEFLGKLVLSSFTNKPDQNE